MKKILFTALIAISAATSAFAKDEKKISHKVLNAFTAEFDDATDVSWTTKPDFNRASFNIDGKQISAFYNPAGEKIGTTQEINFETLPSKARKCIATKYNDYTIKETILFEGDLETAYYVSLENTDQSIILKISSGHVSVFKKKSKN
jgi:hypothetical protein